MPQRKRTSEKTYEIKPTKKNNEKKAGDSHARARVPSSEASRFRRRSRTCRRRCLRYLDGSHRKSIPSPPPSRSHQGSRTPECPKSLRYLRSSPPISSLRRSPRAGIGVSPAWSVAGERRVGKIGGAEFIRKDGAVDDMYGYLNYLSLEYDSSRTPILLDLICA
ncbi:uncharacterized protein LOC125514781 isoform X2 [Triticum urartu]|uniref:uncharacterized protein LOC125514781 isoform X2 n=1 Tax=Triticum urartu TaxID=4572 RepID=UPI00204333CB|nr:uncharacterized protein LOC125514781 isoform X2 [Triticum urartu]